MTCVLENGNPFPLRHVSNRIHVGALAVEMDGLDELRPRRDRFLELRGVQVERIRLDVDEDRPRAQPREAPAVEKNE